MRTLKGMGRALIAASLSVAAGVAVNQILNNGELSWNWGYLALVFTVLGVVMQTPQPPGPAGEETAAPRSRTARRPWRARHAYLRRMRSSVDQMETLGLVTQAEFVLRTRQVYVDVMLQPTPVTDTVADSGIGAVHATAPGRRAPLASFLTQGRVLAVLGAAGSGKTTLARYTALELAEQRWWRRRPLPILLYLRDHAESIQAEQPENLAQTAVTAPWLCDTTRVEWLERRLARGQCVVLLDGLDEVARSSDRDRVVQWVEDQVSRYPGNAFVITSRPVGYKDNRLSCADVLQVQRFTAAQIRAFLGAWYRTIEHRAREGDAQEIDRTAGRAAEDLFRRISGRPALYDLAANPLLLTMIANVHRYRGSLPGSRAALYEEVCQVLLHRRRDDKNLTDGEIEDLGGDRKERVVQELAWHMMRQRLRDVPVEQAERAIRTVLRRTARELAPEAFLAHIRRSGLLLEHQYGRYGFAHLTLQEHLAAALAHGHTSRRQVLMDNVSDPWWRETTLLWAARADASPVVEACLNVRTATALTLAYACADEARELDPALRARLDEILTTTPSAPDEVRLLDGIAVARALQDTHALDDNGTRICAHPVPDNLWDRQRRAYAQTGLAGAPLTADIKDFLAWLNNLLDDGTSYRLPTPAEARQALGGDLFPSGGTALYAADHDWETDHGQVRLILDEPARHPYAPTQHQIDAYPDLILDHTRLVFRLINSYSDIPFAHLLTYTEPRDLADPGQQLLHVVDLAFELACTVAEYIRAIRARQASVRLVDGAFVQPFDERRLLELASDLDRARGLDRAVERTVADVLAYARGLRSAAGVSVDCAALNRALSHAMVVLLKPDPASALARDLTEDRSLSPMFDRARGIAEAYARDLTGAGRSDPGSDHIDALTAMLRDLLAHSNAVNGGDHAFEHPLRLHPAVVDSALGEPLTFHGVQPQDPERIVDPETTDRIVPAGGSRALSDGLDLVHDLAVARAATTGELSESGDALAGLGTACFHLGRRFETLPPWPDLISRRLSEGTLRGLFATFLRAELNAMQVWSPAADPLVALEHARHISGILGANTVETLISNALGYVAPLRDGQRPVLQRDMVLAAVSILAAMTRCEEQESGQLRVILGGALCTLITLTPDTGPRPDAASLVLVRI